MALLLFLLAAIGMTLIIVEGSIFVPAKKWLADHGWLKLVELLNCSQCTGFWSGVFLGYFIDPAPGLTNLAVRLFSYGCISSLVSWAAWSALGVLGSLNMWLMTNSGDNNE